jgi:hypothetical protein
MRHLIAITFASLAAAACSSAPTGTEPLASTTEAQEFCPVGTKPVCTSPSVCKCVAVPPTLSPPSPPVCSFDVPTPPPSPSGPQYSWWIEAWATAQTDGQCPDVATPTGTWSNLDPSYYNALPECFNGVPCVSGDPNPPPPSCSDVFGSEPCCTYVWWPAGFVLEVAPWFAGCYVPAQSVCYSAPSNQSALCTLTGQTFTALENVSCATVGPNSPCGQPGGSGCAGSCPGI